MAVTFAPLTIPPLSSVTVPWMLAEMSCARIPTAHATTSTITRTNLENMRIATDDMSQFTSDFVFLELALATVNADPSLGLCEGFSPGSLVPSLTRDSRPRAAKHTHKIGRGYELPLRRTILEK